MIIGDKVALLYHIFPAKATKCEAVYSSFAFYFFDFTINIIPIFTQIGKKYLRQKRVYEVSCKFPAKITCYYKKLKATK